MNPVWLELNTSNAMPNFVHSPFRATHFFSNFNLFLLMILGIDLTIIVFYHFTCTV